MKLVIVESPTKAKTISGFLGADYKIVSSYGHIRDLPKSKLGIDPEQNFAPQYVIPTKARKVVTELKREAHRSKEIILATDEDREGEAIAWHLAQALGLDGLGKKQSKIESVQRIVFHEITRRAIEEALRKPRPLDLNLVDAQQARRILDRIVGYKLSPFLWKKVASGLSAGRVQSVALRLIVDRENEIESFKKEEYWTVNALLERAAAPSDRFEATLTKLDGKALEKFGIRTKENAEEIVANLNRASFSVESIVKKELRKSPLPPFTTSTLQQEGVKRLRFSAKKTMFLAQRLYESGHITYMRTDSVNLSKESLEAAKAWLHTNLGAAYAAEAPRAFSAKSKLAQEAHEAIRPTNLEHAPGSIPLADEGERKLYELIWNRFLASQAPGARIASTTVHVNAALVEENRSYTLRASGVQILFDGYLKLWQQKLEERELPPLAENEKVHPIEVKPEQHFTEPPPRYSEATLVKTLEEYGIGRPSTYAPTISVIQLRGYVEKEKGRFKPTEVGDLVSRVLTEHFPDIVDIGFTAKMEDDLDEIAAGHVKWQIVMREFYDPFSKRLEEKYAEVSKRELVPEKTDEVCEKCGKPMVVKMSRFGKFLGCSGFPECRNTKRLEGGAAHEGPKKTGLKCPKCAEGEIVERRVSRGRARGKRFWGCSRYPDCDYATWENPTGEKPVSESP